MNALSQAHRAYGARSAPVRTGKSMEYEAVAQITRRLRQAQAQGAPGFSAMAEALHDNQKLWTIFATDVADPKNPLPPDLRARLFYLAEFTSQHSARILKREATVEPLLEINTAILRGLGNGAT